MTSEEKWPKLNILQTFVSLDIASYKKSDHYIKEKYTYEACVRQLAKSTVFVQMTKKANKEIAIKWLTFNY